MAEQRQQRAGSPTLATIDPGAVPDEEYTTACRVLASSIRLALSDPEQRKDYERWKAERAAKAVQKGGET